MKAGVDFGTSLTKVAWKDEEYHFASTADISIAELKDLLTKENVREIYATGIGPRQGFEGFTITEKRGDPIQNEIVLQAEGVKQLLKIEQVAIDDFLLVSLGTGTSYTLVTSSRRERFPIGNAVGGGFIRGIGKIVGINDYEAIDHLAAGGTPLDIFVEDLLPEKSGTFEGKLVVSHFGKAISEASKEDVSASLLHCVAVLVVRDVLLITMMKDFFIPQNIVFIGSPPGRLTTLRRFLGEYTTMIGKTPIFLQQGEFAAALGAFHMEDAAKGAENE